MPADNFARLVRWLVAAVMVGATAPACSSHAPPRRDAPAVGGETQGKGVSAGPRDDEWDTFLTAYVDGYFRAHPDVAVSQGRHEFDGQLPDWSREGLAQQ